MIDTERYPDYLVYEGINDLHEEGSCGASSSSEVDFTTYGVDDPLQYPDNTTAAPLEPNPHINHPYYPTFSNHSNNVGWICPSCGVSNAPFVARCDCVTEFKLNSDSESTERT